MPTRKPSEDWFAFWIRFAFGALFGLLVGADAWVRFADGGPAGWALVPAAALALGAAAGYWGDDFWHGLRDWFFWW